MDIFLGRLTSQAMNYAIRSGITITTTYAIKQCARLVNETTPGSHHREELLQLQLRLESKICILSPSIDMIELISARGNTTLESAVSLTKGIRMDIQRLGMKIAHAAEEEAILRKKPSGRTKASGTERERGLIGIINSIKVLLAKIEDAIPLINLAITTSGVNLSTKLSGAISPSRLLQASTFLTAADAKYAAQPGSRQQVGPTWTLSLYMLFAGHANRAVDEDKVRDATWKEVVHKTRVKLVRVPLEGLYDVFGEQVRERTDGDMNSIPADGKANEFAYQLIMIEDLDDDRVHTFDEDEEHQPRSYEDVTHAGIRDGVPIHEVSKIFYADTGKILNIGGDDDTNNPVLLLKRDIHAEPPRRMLHRSASHMSNPGYYQAASTMNRTTVQETNDDEQSEIDAQIRRESTPTTPQRGEALPAKSPRWRLPADLDPEWMAFEVYIEESESESDPEESRVSSRRPSSGKDSFQEPDLTADMSKLKLKSPSPLPNHDSIVSPQPSPMRTSPISKQAGPRIKTSLSLLEMLIKLTALQQFRQDSHLSIEDELLNFFLEDSATVGAGPDKEFRQRLRHDAVRRVGFDPYDESPVKRRGEEYIAHKRGKASPRPELDINAFQGSLSHGYKDNNDPIRALDSGRPSTARLYSSSQSSPLSPSLRSAEVGHTFSMNNTPPNSSTMSEIHRSVVAKARQSTPNAFSQASLLTMSPNTTKSQREFVRARSEPKASSPLTKRFWSDGIASDDLHEASTEP